MTTPRLLTIGDQRHALGLLTAAGAAHDEGDPVIVQRYLDGLTETEARAAAVVLGLWLTVHIAEHEPDPAEFRERVNRQITAAERRLP